MTKNEKQEYIDQHILKNNPCALVYIEDDGNIAIDANMTVDELLSLALFVVGFELEGTLEAN